MQQNNIATQPTIQEVKKRDNLFGIAVGRKGTGKTNEDLKQALYLAYGNGVHKEKSLFFDSVGELGAYKVDSKQVHCIKTIEKKDIIAYSNFKGYEVRRIVPKHPNGMPMSMEETDELLCYLLEYFRNGLFSISDLSQLYGANLPLKFSGKLTTNRHRSSDLSISIQNIGRLSPIIIENLNYIRLYRTNASVNKYKSRLAEDYEILRIGELIVNKRYDAGEHHFWIYVNKDEMKLEGAFSNKELTEAIQIYLSQTKSELAPLLSMLNSEGQKVYTYPQALMLKTRELFVKYQGNKQQSPQQPIQVVPR